MLKEKTRTGGTARLKGSQSMLIAMRTKDRAPWSMTIRYNQKSHVLQSLPVMITTTRDPTTTCTIRLPKQGPRNNERSNHTADSRELRPALPTMGYGKKCLSGTDRTNGNGYAFGSIRYANVADCTACYRDAPPENWFRGFRCSVWLPDAFRDFSPASDASHANACHSWSVSAGRYCRAKNVSHQRHGGDSELAGYPDHENDFSGLRGDSAKLFILGTT